MASQSTTRRTALKDAASSAHGEDDTAPRQKLKRRATVYDAVAGKHSLTPSCQSLLHDTSVLPPRVCSIKLAN